MDLGSELSGSGSSKMVSGSGEQVVVENGCHVDDIVKISIGESSQMYDGSNEVEMKIDSPKSVSPGIVGESPNTTARKGFGLRKWRRVRRDNILRETSPLVDSSRYLKRGLSGSVSGNPVRGQAHSFEAQQINSGFVEGGNTPATDSPRSVYSTMHGINLELRLEAGSVFSAGTDSENSEDRSSRSSTAASAPKLKYDLASPSGGYPRDGSRVKNQSGKGLSYLIQKGKSQAESSKKLRGRKARMEKEGSRSSMESDSRSPNFIFGHVASSANGNGEYTRELNNDGGEDNDEVRVSTEKASGHASYSGECTKGMLENSNEDSIAGMFRQEKEERTENHRPSKNFDPMVDSLSALQYAQEALEKELQKFKEVGKGACGTHDQIDSEGLDHEAFSPLETELDSSRNQVASLEDELKEMTTMLELKESQIVELEALLNSTESSTEALCEKVRENREETEMSDSEHENLLKQKIEAELENLGRIDALLHRNLVPAKIDVEVHEQTFYHVEKLENKVRLPDKQSKDMETDSEDIVNAEDVAKMRKRSGYLTWCVLLQFTLLLVTFSHILLHSASDSSAVVPT